jgi:hypothetical protein
MRRRAISLVCLLLLPTPAQAIIWYGWELDLGGHTPPVAFVLTATSLFGQQAPPPLRIPYGACSAVAGVGYCAPIGCPSLDEWTFAVRAEYAGGLLSAPSNLAVCRVLDRTCTCSTAPPPVLPRNPPPLDTTPPTLPDGTTPPLPQQGPEGLGLTDTVPPLPQQGPEGLHLRDPSEGLPPIPQPDPVHKSKLTR